MASLLTLQGQGGGRIPMDGFSYTVSRQELAAIIDAMPSEACRQMHIAARAGDTATAQRLLREAAVTYFTTTPAAPASFVDVPRHATRRPRTTGRRDHPSR